MSAELIGPASGFALAAALALAADRLAGFRRADGERGDFWSHVAVYGLCPWLSLLLLSQALPELGWPLAWTLYLDQAGGDGAYWLALSLPGVGWALAVLAGLAATPGAAAPARWLAGGLGFANSRRWLLWAALPPTVLVLLKAGDLGGGASAYPAAVWSTLALAALTLAGLAFSAGRAVEEDGAAVAASPPAGAAGSTAWPECMAAHGVSAQRLADWPAGQPARALRGADAQSLAERLQAMGAAGVAPALLEGVAALLRREPPGDDYGAIRLLFAPDGCGQAEAISLAADRLHRQFHTVTLVVTPGGAEALAAQWRRWLPGVAALGQGEIPLHAPLWVADAEFLSDRLLGRLKNPQLARRVGLVVWWRLDDYSGVMAANLWAISRRLHRLLRVQGRHDIRTLALLRSASPDAQLGDFVRRLLPHGHPAETHVALDWAGPARLYRLEAAVAAPPAGQYLLLRAAAASVAGGWPSFLEPAEFISAQELDQFRQSQAEGGTLAERLRPDAAYASVRLLHLRSAELLALPARLAQSGRALAGAASHIGVMPPANPYARHLLGQLAKNHALPGSKRLVCAESCPAIIRRHVLLALNELPDTRRGLLENALSDAQVVGETLRGLAEAGQLSRREVRFLGDNDRLVCEFEYQSLRIPAGHYCPLDTVGGELLEVREGEAVRLRVDPERLLIAAYPGRVFLREGCRYRIRHWHSVAAAQARGWVECQREDQCYASWRIHTATVFGIRPWRGEAEVAIGRPGLLTRLAVELHYQEEVTGLVEWTEDASRFSLDAAKSSHFVNPHSLTFKTRALALRLPRPPGDAAALPSLCQALRHVLPVHLGVEEDALEVACLNGADINGEEAYGLAIVDLYPGGIGLTDAIRDDSALLLRLLEWTRDWLDACPDDALQTPMALATNPDQAPQRKAALRLLEQIL